MLDGRSVWILRIAAARSLARLLREPLDSFRNQRWDDTLWLTWTSDDVFVDDSCLKSATGTRNII